MATFNRHAPTALTTIGVIGTFLGIYVGLMDFNVKDIDGSIPSLLAGLKIAFSTSIMGMIASVLLKFIQGFIKPKNQKEDVSASDIYHVMAEVRDETKSNRSHSEEMFEGLKKAISGDGDSSLVTQIVKLRSTSHDDSQELKSVTKNGFTEMKEEFQTFAEKIAENNSKALIDALQEVIRDFNAKINEQFGENFKQLNEAVGALLTWQENYKTHVEGLVAEFDEVRAGITQTRDAVVTIGEKSKEIPATMGELSKTIKVADDQIEVLKSHLEAVAELREKAITAFPVIEENLETLTTNFTNAVTDNSGLITSALSEQTSHLKETTTQNISLLEETAAHHKTAVETLETSMHEMPKQVGNVLASVQIGVEKATDELNGRLEESLTKSANLMSSTLTAQTDYITDAAEETFDLLEKTTERHNEAVTKLETNISELPKRVDSVLSEVQTGIDDALTAFTKEMETGVRSQTDSMHEVTVGLRESLQQSLTETNDVIQQSFQVFDEQMQSEIGRTIETMGGHLASLSNKFVEDYSPLTEKLRRVVEISQRTGA